MTCLNVVTVLAAVFMAVLSPAALAQQDYADRANSLIESYARSDLFSGSVLVAQHGKAIFRKAFGPANREWDIPNTLETKFRIGSVTKQFTAAAILQLAEQGKLKLDDPMSKYYADAPRTWEKITIRHLLAHVSGIPSYTALPDFFTKLSRADRTPQEIIKLTQDLPFRGRKSHPEQIWSALPQIADIDSSREDFSIGPKADVRWPAVERPNPSLFSA